MSVKEVIFQCDLCDNESNAHYFGLSGTIYGVIGECCKETDFKTVIRINPHPNVEPCQDTKEIHICHCCLKKLGEAWKEIDKHTWEQLGGRK